jgi:putative transposase
MAKFRTIRSLQKFAAVHASILNHFNLDRHLNRRNVFKENRTAALAAWRQLAAPPGRLGFGPRFSFCQ